MQKKTFKLAPFKLRFSKMSKSRSGGSSGSSVESEDPHLPPNMSTESDGYSEMQSTGATSLVSQNSIPYSPPPSYEHVLEEVTKLILTNK